MKLKRIALLAPLLTFSNVSLATFECDNPPQFGQRTVYEEIIDFILTQIGMTKQWCISEDHKSTSLYFEDNDYITYGEPFDSVGLLSNNFPSLSFQDGFTEACVSSSRFRRMPIVSNPVSTERKYLYYSPNIDVKRFYAYRGVPFKVKAHDRGWATKELSPSFYHWNFGDGARAYAKDDDKHTVTHIYKKAGIYQLDSIVLTKFGEVGVSIGGSFGSAAFSWSTPIPYYKTSGVGIDSCDIAIVEVKENTAPVAKFTRGSSGYGRTVNLSFDASLSSDPDGNEILSYNWLIDGVAYQGKNIPRLTKTRSDTIRYINATLTVSDGGLEHSVTKRVMIPPICYSCNGSGLNEK
ncbi:PKD domain-containing protein [Shewanella khirikhana]|uniref:PKD domain-containing protein n=1 Tax=Shewanella khirikhana TaxID=1965282 RepID=UPI0030CE8AB1